MSYAADADATAGPLPEPAAAAEPEASAVPVPLSRNSGFRMLWIGQVLSDTGTRAAFIAYPLLILDLTRSPAIAGAVGTVSLVVQLVFGLPGGALSDRMDRRLTMIGCDAIRAVVLGTLAVLVLLHVVTWPIVLAVAVIDSAANVLFDPAATAALPGIVANEQLEQAWIATEARSYAANLAGPAVGGFLFGLGSSIPFIGDALSYLVSVGTVSRIRGRFRPERSGERKSLGHEVLDGLRMFWHHRLLRALMFQAPLINFAFTGVLFTITLALRKHGTSATVIGLAQAGIAVGGLAGAVLAMKFQGRLRLSQLVIGMTMIATVLFAAGGLLLPSTLVAIPVAITFMLAPTTNAALFAAALRVTPEEMRGRLTSTAIMIASALAALAPLTAGLMVQHFSGRWAMLTFAVAVGFAAILAVTLRGLNDTELVAAPG
jgi:MFS family permease